MEKEKGLKKKEILCDEVIKNSRKYPKSTSTMNFFIYNGGSVNFYEKESLLDEDIEEVVKND